MIFTKTHFISIPASIISFFLFATPAFAHVIVYPKQTGIAQTQIFDMTVPTEKDNPTISLKLLIPSGIQNVIPNVKQGWIINVVKNGNTVTEIDWTNGSIPPDQRDDFYFQAQVPPKPTILKWKAYQTYQDGSVVAWDHAPTANPEDDSAPPPYSTTEVINDLTGSKVNGTTTENNSKFPVLISTAALALSALSLGISIRKKK